MVARPGLTGGGFGQLPHHLAADATAGALQRRFERWGDSDLSARVSADSKDEVAFLGQRFNQAAQRIESLMNSHKSLLANASRKLRSPLS